MILGDSTFCKIKTEEIFKGNDGDPIVEGTSFGWLIHGGDICKVFSAKPFTATATSLLPVFRRNPVRPFEVRGVDFAGSLINKVTKKEDRNILHNYIYVRHVASGSFGTGKIADMQLKSFKQN